MEILIKLITYFIIYTVIGIVLKRIKDSQKKRAIPKDCVDYFDTKVQSIFFLCSGIFFMIITILCMVFGGGSASIVFFIFSVIILAFSCITGQWYVAVKKDGIETESFLSKKKFISFGEVTKAKYDAVNNVRLYSGEKQIFKLEKEYDAKKLVSVLKRNGISIEHENSYNDFVIRRSKIVIYVWSFLAVAGIVIIGCSLSSEDRELALYGGMLGGALALASLGSAAEAWYSKTVVKNEKICQHALLRIKKELSFEQVQYIIMTVENQIQYANIYSNNKKIMRVSMSDLNSNMFRDVMKQQGWDIRSE